MAAISNDVTLHSTKILEFLTTDRNIGICAIRQDFYNFTLVQTINEHDQMSQSDALSE